MSLFQPIPKPTSRLGYTRLLSPTIPLRVSPLCLGSANFGHAWQEWLGDMEKETAFQILDYFYEKGGNFIDTATNYQSGESETWLGEWMERRGNREEMVIATKFSTPYPIPGVRNRANHHGNHAKNLRFAVETSLERLKTSYIDVLYVHWWDFSASVEEVMQSLNHLVAAGKVLYLGVSDTPAWIVSKANQYARDHGLRQFGVYQGRWSAAQRDLERDIIPMARAEGMGLTPWGALGGGNFKTEEQRKSGEGRKPIDLSEKDVKVSEVLERIAKRKDTLLTSVALAYIIQKTPYVFPVVGGRKVEHLKGNIEALGLELSEAEIKEIEGAVPFDVGFPMDFLFSFMGAEWDVNKLTTDRIHMVRMGTHLDGVELPKPIKPHTEEEFQE